MSQNLNLRPFDPVFDSPLPIFNMSLKERLAINHKTINLGDSNGRSTVDRKKVSK